MATRDYRNVLLFMVLMSLLALVILKDIPKLRTGVNYDATPSATHVTLSAPALTATASPAPSGLVPPPPVLNAQ